MLKTQEKLMLVRQEFFLTLRRANLFVLFIPSTEWIRATYSKGKRTVKKDLHDPDNHDGVITHLELDILEGEVKWALGASLRTKLVEAMEFQLSYFKS